MSRSPSRSPASLALAFVASAAVPVALEAQSPPETRLAAPTARWEEPLSSIRGLRELPDGRVLVADGIDDVLLRIDLARGRADTISRSGQGPGEYKMPDALFAMPAGGTLVMDLGNGRLTHYLADGKYKDSWSIARGQPGRGMLMVTPQGVDTQGRIYFQARGGGPGGPPPTSAPVIRWTPATDKFDTLATIKLPEVSVSTSGASNNRNVTMRQKPLSAQDGWAVASDGRIGIVRADPFRVDWVDGTGKVTTGPAIPWTPVKVTDADKKAWIAAMSNGLGMMMTNENGQMSVRFMRGTGGRQAPNASEFEWPETKPAFVPPGVAVAPSGELWVERNMPAGTAPTYDVFGADGRIVQRVLLPTGRRFEGFGNGTIYLSRVDESDLRYLERYAMPR